MSKKPIDRRRKYRKFTKQRLLDIADEIVYRRFDDGRITGIDLFKKKALIHQSTAYYATLNEILQLVRVTGKFQSEIFQSWLRQRTLPNQSSDSSAEYIDLDGTEKTTIYDINGAGAIIALNLNFFKTAGTIAPGNIKLHFTIDNDCTEHLVSILAATVQFLTKTISPLSVGIYDTSNHIYQLSFNHRISFTLNTKLEVENLAGAGNKFNVYHYLWYELI